EAAWRKLRPGYEAIVERQPRLDRGETYSQLGTLGGGNHFIELCLDESQRVWAMLHSGSRGVGNRIGSHYIDLAKKDMRRHVHELPDADLSYFKEGSEHFDEYVEAVDWAQRFARTNRDLMMAAVFEALAATKLLPRFTHGEVAVNCHHNYVEREEHFGASVFVTRKGAVRAGAGELGIIPGSMGARSYIVRGKGNPESFHSCSHGAGRVMSRGEAQRKFSLADHIAATEGVECRKDREVIDETPGAYKDIEAVMAAQSDLVEVVHTLKQVVCVKG
ncbi:MAG: RtcB family protein, partial [Planctomycetaceae bacterium]|nr:RtcB family protein [Planctomycetaceae bacterium]